MSQQRMHYDESEQPSYATGYEEMPRPDERFYPPRGYVTLDQKLDPHYKLESEDKRASAGQRLALAIVSLVMLFIAFFFTALGEANSSNGALQFFLMVGFVLFFVAVIVINAIFNRRH